MGLWGKKREPITHRRCFQVIESLKAQLLEEKRQREREQEAADARIKKLERRLKQDSGNSSRPPSSDFPHRKYPRRTPSGKKRGGQKGHPGFSRRLFPADQVTETIRLKPTQCSHCHSEDLLPTHSVIRHHQVELPEIQVEVKAYQRYVFHCRSCKRRTVAPLPVGVTGDLLGPHLQSLSAFGVGELNLSKRQTVKFLEHLLGRKLSAATVVNYEKKTSEALAPFYAEAQAILETEPWAHVDETGWKEENHPAWLWGAKTAQVTVYRIDRHRSREARNNLLGKFSGVLISDQLSTYADWDLSKWQLCWAHIRRYLKCFSELEGKAAEIGKKAFTVSDAVFHTFHQMKRGDISFATLGQEMARYQEVFHGFLDEGLTCIDQAVASVCSNWLKREEALWTFTRIPGIEPTNNAAEQSLRPVVIHRKTSYGTQSEDGSRFLERLFTVAATLKQHKEDVVEFLRKAIQARLTGGAPPLLAPARVGSPNTS